MISFDPMGSAAANKAANYRDEIPMRLMDLFEEIQRIKMMGRQGQYGDSTGAGAITGFTKASGQGLQGLQDMYYKQPSDRRRQMGNTSSADIASQLLSPDEYSLFDEEEKKRLGIWGKEVDARSRAASAAKPAPEPLGSIEETMGLIGSGTFKGKPYTYPKGRGSEARLGTLGINFPGGQGDSLANIQKSIEGIFGARKKREDVETAAQLKAKTIPAADTWQYKAELAKEAARVRKAEEKEREKKNKPPKVDPNIEKNRKKKETTRSRLRKYYDTIKTKSQLEAEKVAMEDIPSGLIDPIMYKDTTARIAQDKIAGTLQPFESYIQEEAGGGEEQDTPESIAQDAMTIPGLTEQQIRERVPLEVADEIIMIMKAGNYQFVVPVANNENP